MSEIKALKPTVEILYAEELAALEANDDGPKPANWRLSPKAVRTFIIAFPRKIAGKYHIFYKLLSTYLKSIYFE